MKLLLYFVFAATSPLIAADPVGKVETTLTAAGDTWVGQRVPLTIKISAPGFSIEGVPAFDIPEISGLIVLKLPGSPRIGNETVEDVTYVTQVHEFALFPQRPGEFKLPGFAVRFSSSAGYGKPVTAFNVKTQSWAFTAKLPPGAERLRTLISTNQLTFTESWSPDAKSAKVGDAVTRTITMTASDVPGMEFPPLQFAPIEGIGVYRKQPAATDATDRGSLTGQRVETVTYVFEKPGTYTLPGLSLTWWKLDDKALKQETIDARTVVVSGTVTVANSGASGNDTSSSSRWPSPWILVIAAVLVAITVSLVLLRHRKLVGADLDEESTRFTAFEEACRTNDRRRILAALTAWLDCRAEQSEPVLLAEWASRSGDRDLMVLVDQLETSLFQRPTTTSDASFAGDVLLARVRQLGHQHARPHRAHTRGRSLKPLNPR